MSISRPSVGGLLYLCTPQIFQCPCGYKIEGFLFLLCPISGKKGKCWACLKPPAVSSQSRTAGRDLLQWAFSFTIKHPQEGEMKDKSSKRAETEENEIIADLICSCFVCKIITCVGVGVWCCNKICRLNSPNLTFGWYSITCCVRGRLWSACVHNQAMWPSTIPIH